MEPDSVDDILAAWARSRPDLDTSPLGVVGRLLLCAGHLERRIDAALGPHGLSFADFDVVNTLRRLADPHGTKPGELARSALITTGAMTTRLDRLEQAGLLARSSDRHDRRAVRVRLTARGRRVADAALAAVLDVDRTFLEPLSSAEQQPLAAGLRRLLSTVESQP